MSASKFTDRAFKLVAFVFIATLVIIALQGGSIVHTIQSIGTPFP